MMNKYVHKKIFKFHKEPTLVTSNKNTERLNSSDTLKSMNSFLVEIDHNFDIDSSIRKDIEKKFKRSAVNATYKFPRLSMNEKLLPRIGYDRRYSPEIESSLNSFESRKQKKKGNREISLNEKFRAPNISRKALDKERKAVACSITPSPYIASFKNKETGTFDIKRFTPSPAPRGNAHTLRIDRNLL